MGASFASEAFFVLGLARNVMPKAFTKHAAASELVRANNARDIIEDLRLLYNKTRQEKITAEILDIAGGVFANA